MTEVLERPLEDETHLIDEVARRVADLQDAVQLLDETAARRLGLHLTDLRCVRRVIQEGPKSASQLAVMTGLTRAAISAVLDRLERAKVAKRVADPSDRRRILVKPTESGRQQIARIWTPIELEGRRELGTYSVEELTVIVDFLEKSIDLQHRHVQRLEESAGSTS